MCAGLLFGVLKATMGIRVSEDEEFEGLDFGEHGMHAYDLHTGGSMLDPHGPSSSPAPSAATQLAADHS